MFDSLSERMCSIFEKLRKSGVLKESDIDEALRSIRIALLEADVALDVAKKFMLDVKEKAIGQGVLRSITPGQTVVKIVNDHLVELLGEQSLISTKKPHKIVLVGLQGAGKTTTAGKLARYFSKQNKKVVLASVDVYRPAAIEQLRVLSSKIDNTIFPQEVHEHGADDCKSITKLALSSLSDSASDLLILDTAGRLHIDEVKMDELIDVIKIVEPNDVFLVADIMMGQDSINVAKKFSELIGLSGVILTRVDADARGGTALSMRALTNCQIKFLCTGERIDDLELFDAKRVANRLLGMGDIVSLVEKVQSSFSEEEALKTADKLQTGTFSLDDMVSQIESMSKLGGIKSIIKMLPQSKQLEGIMESQGISDKTIEKNVAIIRSMTKKEKANYKILNGSRRKRIAAGSGTTIQEVNVLIKQYEASLTMFKKMKKLGGISKMMSMFKR